MDPIETPGVTETSPAPEVQPSVEISAEATPASGSEAVTTPVEEPKQTVPFERFQEVNNELKELRQRVDGITSKIEPEVTEEPVQLDPDTSALLDSWAKQNGFVRQADIAAERAVEQAQKDLADIKTQFKLDDAGLDRVRQAAIKAGATNREGLENAYYRLNFDTILEQRVKEELAKNGGTPVATVEKPGPGGSTTPVKEQPAAGTDIKSRIRAARGV